MLWFRYKQPPLEFRNWVMNSIHFFRENYEHLRVEEIPETIFPLDEIFPLKTAGQQFYHDMYEKVKVLMKIPNCKCELQLVNKQKNIFEGSGLEYEHTSTAGTYNDDYYFPKITLTLSKDNDIYSVIATLAHELSHYIIHNIPGYVEDEMDEPLTDFCAIYHGFGIFLLIASFQVKSFGGTAYTTKRLGYLTNGEIMYILAILYKIKKRNIEELKPYIAGRQYKEIRNHFVNLNL